MDGTAATRRTRPPAGGRVRAPSGRAPRPGAGLRAGVLAAVLAPVLCIPGIAPARAATVSFGNALAGGATVNKDIESMRERRFAYLVEQQTDYSCGAAALASILRYAYDMDGASESRVLEGLFSVADREKVRERGFSLLDLKKFVETLGMRGRGYEVAPDTLGRIQVPTIVLVNIDGYRHFVVLRHAEGDRVYLGDPALGNRVMRRQAFLDSWNGIVFAVIGPGFDEETGLMRPRARVTARRLHDLYAPVPPAEAIGFGLRRAELF